MYDYYNEWAVQNSMVLESDAPASRKLLHDELPEQETFEPADRWVAPEGK